jgi:hypothetical protein
MDEREMLLIITACELLGKSVTPRDIEKASETAKKRLEHFLHPQPPREPIVSHVRDRE